MPKVIVSIDGVVIKEVELTQERTTLGRRPYNNIVIDNLAVSGEHAVLHMPPHSLAQQAVEIEDLGSTNGTYVNAKPVQRQALHNGDTIEIGKYKIRFLNEAGGDNFEATMVYRPGTAPPASPSASAPAPGTPPPAGAPLAGGGGMGAAAAPQVRASVRVLTGVAAGREVALTKVVTTIGKPGVAVAAITRRHQGFVLAHVEGPDMPHLNGTAIGTSPMPLSSGDLIELAGTQMQFVQE